MSPGNPLPVARPSPAGHLPPEQWVRPPPWLEVSVATRMLAADPAPGIPGIPGTAAARGVLALARHGESTWSTVGRYTGWSDPPLTEAGVGEARSLAERLRHDGLVPDEIHASVLMRAAGTAAIVMSQTNPRAALRLDWRLNERHWGQLEGLDKHGAVQRFGRPAVRAYRRTFHACPPRLEVSDERHPRRERRYDTVSASDLPAGEALQDTMWRALGYLEREVYPALAAGACVLVVTHAHTIRALRLHLEGLREADAASLPVPTGSVVRYAAAGLPYA